VAVVEALDVVVIGGGQAGLATSHELKTLGIDHTVLERGRIAQSWRGRWDSFCLVTPNWTMQMPGLSYDGDDPDGYMPRDHIVAFFERYAATFQAPVREGIEVTSLEVSPEGGFLLQTSDGDIRAATVVVSTGAYQRPHRPPGAADLPGGLLQLDAEDYTNPDALPPGPVLVVGSGQTGCQIAEELHDAGRDVFLACGRAPWGLRRFGDRDLVWWAVETGFLDQGVAELPNPAARLFANVLATGHDGGHDLHLRTLRAKGVTLLGHFLGAEDHRAGFADDLGASVEWGDERYREFSDRMRKLVNERGLPMPDIPEPAPFDGSALEHLDLSGFGAVLFTSGFRPDYGSWVHVPGAFDDMGFPIHSEGASPVAPGLHFVGVHFLRKRKSSLLVGVGEDAAIVARQIASPRPESPPNCDDGPMTDDLAAFLEDKKVKLEAELAKISAPPEEGTQIGFGKRVGEGTSMAVDRLVQVATYDEMQAVLADVNRALAKLAEGSYGSCDRCGAAIPPERLEALPWSVLCVTCASHR
jgi:putative flavoprotein involved in K+ transport